MVQGLLDRLMLMLAFSDRVEAARIWYHHYCQNPNHQNQHLYCRTGSSSVYSTIVSVCRPPRQWHSIQPVHWLCPLRVLRHVSCCTAGMARRRACRGRRGSLATRHGGATSHNTHKHGCTRHTTAHDRRHCTDNLKAENSRVSSQRDFVHGLQARTRNSHSNITR